METVFERKLKGTFTKSDASSNVGISVAFFALAATAVFAGIGYWTRAEWVCMGFLVCGVSAIAGAGFAVLAQTVTRLAWLAAKLANRIRDRKIHLPAEETPQFVKVVAHPLKIAVTRFKERQLPKYLVGTAPQINRVQIVSARSHDNARAHRSAARPTFSRPNASNASKGSSDGGSSDEPGGSDSGDGPQFLTNLKLQPLFCTKKRPENPAPVPVLPKLSVPNQERPVGRCPA